MADVTDAAFRRILAKYGDAHVTWTEFVSVEGLSHKVAREKLIKDLEYDEAERPIVAQIFGADPKKFTDIAKLIASLGFDGIDINMGCPDRSINKQHAGADLMKNTKLAREIIRATKDGAGTVPVSVKTRLGYSKDELETWLQEILAEEPVAVTVHGRTMKELSLVPARWERIARAKEIATEMESKALIIGNGDVVSLEDAKTKAETYKVDGVMIGRGVFGNPWFFSSTTKREEIPFVDRMKVMLEHVRLFDELIRPHKSFAVMRKHFKSYTLGYKNGKALREVLMRAESAKDVEETLKDFGFCK